MFNAEYGETWPGDGGLPRRARLQPRRRRQGPRQ